MRRANEAGMTKAGEHCAPANGKCGSGKADQNREDHPDDGQGNGRLEQRLLKSSPRAIDRSGIAPKRPAE